MRVLAIDPGNVYSAYVIIDEQYNVLAKGKIKNGSLRRKISGSSHQYDVVVIEMIVSYGMRVGQTVFETCYWIGRFSEAAKNQSKDVYRITRPEVKKHVCPKMRAKDKHVVAALKIRFGEVGTKKQPGFFYGFKADIWQAMALGVTFVDKKGEWL